MIIHDMRGPVNSMKLGLEKSIDILNSHKESYDMYTDLVKNQDEIKLLL